ncbi:hypothetical protein QYE76_034806 [Lolium multiflorum]|uniref:Integrase catalytic domain-containing protein n=1 Tax=Lolium multiflorum TaxID=4521 RepID=A0AAD8VNN0_LOLMU|nr:hypothetical protein QYE76_034806 [Lolium multiflorum]
MVWFRVKRLGSIKLPVAFGDVNNYREEMITFEVVPFKSSYHVIFGRPTYHKFHASMLHLQQAQDSGPNEELQGYGAAVDPTEMQTTKKQISEQKTSFKATIETKKHDLIEGATYQRTMQRCPKDQIGRNVHAYVDDIAVMTRKGSDLLSDLKETFDNLRRLVTRFGIPHSIITDNGTNFAQGELKDYCDEVGIRLDLASVAHPQSNGQVERANGLILAESNLALKNRCAAQPELGR